MKIRKILPFVLCLFTNLIKAQTGAEDPILENFPPPLQVGIALGYNFLLHNYYDYSISQIDNTLQKDKIDKSNFVGSLVLTYAIPFHYVNTKKKEYDAPGPFCVMASFNFAEVNTGLSFNSKLSGGLGAGFNIKNTVHVGFFYDITKARFLRDAFRDSVGKKLVVAGIPMTSLDQTNNGFFKDGILTSLSIKFIYILSRRSSDIKRTNENNVNKLLGIEKK